MFFMDVFKSFIFVAKFFEGVRMNEISAKLVLCILSITEDILSDVHLSIWPINLFVGFLKAHTLSSSSSRE